MLPVAVALWLCAAALPLAPPARALNATRGLGSPTRLPSFIPRCSIKDPEIRECIVRAANEAIPKVAQGYAPLNLPTLDPLVIDEITLETGSRASLLNLKAHNIVITGLAKAQMLDITFSVDPKNHSYTVSYFVPWFQVEADYEVNGQILVLPIKGNDRANLTFENVTLTYLQPFKIVKKSDGRIHHDFLKSHGEVNTTRAHFQLENLFNGDKVLGEQLNIFLNENWRDIVADLGEPFTDAATEVIYQFLVILNSKIPYDEIFLDVDVSEQSEQSEKDIYDALINEH